jgi:hypothetical protein
MLAKKLFGLCIFALALIVVCSMSADWARRYRDWWLLTEHPAQAQATVESLETGYTVRYRYPLPGGASATGSAQVSPARYAVLHQGDRLPIVYSARHPEQSVLLGQLDSPPDTPWILVLAFSSVVAFVILAWWRSYRRANELSSAPAFNPLGVSLAKSPQQILEDTARRNRISLRAILVIGALAGVLNWSVAFHASWAEPLARYLLPPVMAGALWLVWWAGRCTVCGQGRYRWYGRCGRCGSTAKSGLLSRELTGKP